jgi:hypothetical protein
LSLAAALFALVLPMGAPTLAQSLQLNEERESSAETTGMHAWMVHEARIVRSRSAHSNPLVFTPPIAAPLAWNSQGDFVFFAGHRLPCGQLAPLRC